MAFGAKSASIFPKKGSRNWKCKIMMVKRYLWHGIPSHDQKRKDDNNPFEKKQTDGEK